MSQYHQWFVIVAQTFVPAAPTLMSALGATN